MKKQLPYIIAILIIACVYVLFFWQPAEQNKHSIASVLPAGKSTGGDFELQSLGGVVSLKDFRGKVVLLYFGYTMCPDVCPTNLSLMANALAQLNAEEKAKVQGIFVSVDPQRDTMERLSEYTHYFHELLIGISGSPEKVREIADRYGVAYQKVVQQDSATDYVVDHSSETYVVDPQGKLVQRLSHAAPPAEILAAIRKYSI